MNEWEQGAASIRDGLPRMWWNIYQGCLQAGFDQEVSMSLLHTFIGAQFGKGNLRPNDKGPPKDTGEEK